MPDFLLKTKLTIPPNRPNLVPRVRLVRLLDEGVRLGRKVTLVSAPAGYGKTTAITQWLAADRLDGPAPGRVAWIALDEDDNDSVRFLTYLIAALQTVDAALGHAVMGLLDAPNPPSVQAILGGIVNEMSAWSERAVLVFDDYHVIHDTQVHEALRFLVRYQPEALHLVLASRADPPLAFARLRAQNHLTELRAEGLRFARDEAEVMLHGLSAVALSADALEALVDRTEGWAAGLQMAGLSLDAETELSAFLGGFTGRHRYILDYLMEEVLHRQPDSVRDFLLQTSILDRMHPDLCDAVTGAAPGTSAQRLKDLEAANLFLVPLDAERRWYRYHRLFVDLLRARAEHQMVDALSALHRRAARWLRDHGRLSEAFRHALAADEVDFAAEMVSNHGMKLLRQGAMRTLSAWLDAFPESVIANRGRLSVFAAWIALLTGHPAEIPGHLHHAEVQLETHPDRVVVGHVAAIRAYAAAQRGQVADAVEQARGALARLPEDELSLRAIVHFTLGGAALMTDDLETAESSLRIAATLGERGGNLHLAISALDSLAVLQHQRGNLGEMRNLVDRMLALATDAHGRVMPVGGGALSMLAVLAYAVNDLEEAIFYADESLALCRTWGNVGARMGSLVDHARVCIALGDLDAAREDLAEAEALTRGAQRSPLQMPHLRTAQISLLLASGDRRGLERWIAAAPPLLEGYFGLDETLMRARLYLALGNLEEAEDLSDRALARARVLGLDALASGALGIRALALDAQSMESEALTTLRDAVMLAYDDGLVRQFTDMGSGLIPLLRDLDVPDAVVPYVSRLLDTLNTNSEGRTQAVVPFPGFEPLSDRETEVLAYVAEGLTNQEIASRLYIVESTVKSHLHHVYQKLQVSNRTEAVARARDLLLFEA